MVHKGNTGQSSFVFFTKSYSGYRLVYKMNVVSSAKFEVFFIGVSILHETF